MASNKVDFEVVRRLLSYDAATGIFTWRARCGGILAGTVAGLRKKSGYVHIGIAAHKYSAHRLAWLWSYGSWPVGEIDHRNGVPWDNRLCNLRDATRSENEANKPRTRVNATGLKGISAWRNGKWRAQITKRGRQIYLGTFATAEEAHAAYAAAAIKHFGEFARVA